MTRTGEMRICSLIRVVILSAMFFPFPESKTKGGGGPHTDPHHPLRDDRNQTNIAYGHKFCKWGNLTILITSGGNHILHCAMNWTRAATPLIESFPRFGAMKTRFEDSRSSFHCRCLSRVDACCLEFELAWLAGERPAIGF